MSDDHGCDSSRVSTTSENRSLGDADSDAKLPDSNTSQGIHGEPEPDGFVNPLNENGDAAVDLPQPEAILEVANQELGSQNTDHVALLHESNDEFKITEDTVKEDMFVDAPDELTSYDGRNTLQREASIVADSHEGLGESSRNNIQENSSRGFVNGVQVHPPVAEVDGLQAKLENAAHEKDRIAQDLKEERDAVMEEVSKLHQQLMALTDQQSFFVESDGGLVDQLHKAEFGVNVGKAKISNTPLCNLIDECSEYLKMAMAERSRTDATMRELHAILFMKDEQIEDLSAKVNERSVSHDAVVSSLSSAQDSLNESSGLQLEKDQKIEKVADAILESLAAIVGEPQPLDNSITGKMCHLEKMTFTLINNYNKFLLESSELRQKEQVLVEKLSVLEEEHKKLFEQLEKSTEVAEIATAEIGKTKMELEQEKNRSANVKEKLTLAVTKGKALVQQRDSLRQSLADKTSELEKCMTDLQEKTSALEAAELSKASLVKSDALVASVQESLLQREKDIERLEEILSETAVPEEFQSANILEKVKWLVEDRNVLTAVSMEFHRLKDALSVFDLPGNVASCDFKFQVSWLGKSYYYTRDELSRVKDEVYQMREAGCNEIDCLTASLSAEIQENAYLHKLLEELTREYDEVVVREHRSSLEKFQMVRMLLEASGITTEGEIYQSPSDMHMLIDGCFHKIKEQSIASFEFPHVDTETFERIQCHLYVRDLELTMCKIILEEVMMEIFKLNQLSNQLEIASQELLELREEKSSLLKDFERSEEKSAMLREKLSLAVKKGKGLVQEREHMKAVLDEKKNDIEKLMLELQQRDSALDGCKNHVQKLSNDLECIPKLEADLVSIKGQKDQLEQQLVVNNNVLQRLTELINNINFPVDSVSEELVEKVKWLSGYFSECQFTLAHAKQELEGLKEEAKTLAYKLAEAEMSIKSLDIALSLSEENVSRLTEERKELEVGKPNIEQQLQIVVNEANFNLEQELGRVKEEVSTLAGKLEEDKITINSLKAALSVSENKVSQLAEEIRGLEVGKANVEHQLQRAVEEGHSQASKISEVVATAKTFEDVLSEAKNTIAVLSTEKEDAKCGRAAAETELEKLKDGISTQTEKLAEAYRTIQSLEVELSQETSNLALLTSERNEAEAAKTSLEDELRKLKEEVGSQSNKLKNAEATTRSLEDALVKAEKSVSELTCSKNVAEQEILTLNSKLNACMEELAGIHSSSDSRMKELFDPLSSLQMLLKDDAMVSKLRRSIQNKFESLKPVDLLIKNLREQLHVKGSEFQKKDYIVEVESYWGRLISTEPNSMIGDVDVGDVDNVSLAFTKTVKGLHLRNETLMHKFEVFSTFMDEFIASLLRDLQEIRDGANAMHDDMESLKQKVKDMESHYQDQEDTITSLNKDIEVLLSACSNAAQELRYEVGKYLPQLDYVPKSVAVNFLEKMDAGGDGADQHERLTGSNYMEMAEQLLSAVDISRALNDQFENLRNLSQQRISKLESDLDSSHGSCTEKEHILDEYKVKVEKLEEIISNFECDLEALHNSCAEKEHKLDEYKVKAEKLEGSQERISKLESDLEALHYSCIEKEHKLDEYEVKVEKLEGRETELLTSYNTLLKQKETEGQLLSSSQLQMLFDKVNGITIHLSKSAVGHQELHNSAHLEKLFNIIDSIPELQHQIKVLSRDKEELQLSLKRQVVEFEQMKEKAETKIRDNQELEDLKGALLELSWGLEKLIQKLGGTSSVGEKKSIHAGEILAILEKLVASTILESEDSKFQVQELDAKLSRSQKLVDELSTKLKLLEDSIQGWTTPPETVRERSIYEAPSLPSGTEISEIEDVGSVGKNAMATTSAAHVRTMRKGSSDHLALNIDSESDHLISSEETVEDKGHVFKSLNTTGLIPKQGKIITDRVDGIWVSGSRLLMNRPRARLCLVAYWLLLHIWLLGTLL